MNKIYLTITPFFPTPDYYGGPFIYDQVKALNRIGKYNNIVLKPNSFFSRNKDYEYKGIKVYHFKYFALPSNLFPGLFNRVSLYFLKQKIKSLGININAIAIVHAHSVENGYFANQLKKFNYTIKTILQHHGLDVLGLRLGRFSKFKWHLYLVKCNSIKICNEIDLHIGVSKKTIESLKSYNGIKIKDEYVLYNGVDYKKFFEDKAGKTQIKFRIGCIANFIKIKDQITLVKATCKLIAGGMNDLMISFIGSGPTLNNCKKYVMENGLDAYFNFEKEIDHSDLREFYNRLDLFIMPSYYEAFGCVYVEAFVCGVPFIAVKNQGIEELIDCDSDNWLIERSDSKQLAVLIKEFRKNRPKQIINRSLKIDDLISAFLMKVKSL